MRESRGAEFDDFVRARSGALPQVAYLLVGDRHAAEDLLQEVLAQLYGATPDGRRLYVTTLQFDDDPARAIALLARGDTMFEAVASMIVSWSDPLPARLRLPAGQGTLVAAR